LKPSTSLSHFLLISIFVNGLEELIEIAAFDLAHASGEGVILLEGAIAEIEQQKLSLTN
jgi:hypothetical protein